MVAAPKKNLGKIPCPNCRQPVALMQAPTGTLSHKCQEADCEATGYAPSHTGAAKKWLAALPKAPAPAADPAPSKPVPKAPAKAPEPTPAPQKGAFDLSRL